MAIAFVQGTGVQGASAPSQTCAFGSNVVAGNLLIVMAITNGLANTDTSCTDSQGNTYTVARRADRAGADTEQYIWWAIAGSSAACTVTVDPTGSAFESIAIAEVSGQDSSPADAGNDGEATTSTAATTNSITTAVNDFVCGIVSHDGATTSITEGFTVIFENESGTNMPINAQYRITTADAALTWTLGAARNWTALGFGFKEAAAAVLPRRPVIVRQAVNRASTW